jgi:hypothetical protein
MRGCAGYAGFRGAVISIVSRNIVVVIINPGAASAIADDHLAIPGCLRGDRFPVIDERRAADPA